MLTKPLPKITERIEQLLPRNHFDLVVGVARGGIIPAVLAASYLELPIDFIWINFRNDRHEPVYREPILLYPFLSDVSGKKILLADDRSNTGKTLEAAKSAMIGAEEVRTCAINGRADYSLFEEECFRMPWDLEREGMPGER